MRVYRCPTQVPWAEPDYRNYDREAERQREREHQEKLAAWLVAQSYTGPYTGGVVSYPVADSYARYMLADGQESILILLPYVDEYQYRHIEFLPKEEIISEIERGKRMAAHFAQRDAERQKAISLENNAAQ